MKIHFLSHPTAFSLPGGGEVQMLETIKELQKIGHECILLDINDTSQWSSIQYLHLFLRLIYCYSFCIFKITIYLSILNILFYK